MPEWERGMASEHVRLLGALTVTATKIEPAEQALEQARAFERHARSTLRPMTGKFAWQTIAHFACVLLGAGMVAAFAINGYLSYWAAVPLNAILIYFLFAPLHEATHGNIIGPYSGLRWLESLIGHISGFVLLAPYVGFRPLHLHHHNHTNEAGEDPDYWVKSDSYLFVMLRCMAIQPVYVIHLYKIAKDPVTMRAFVWEMVSVAFYILIIVAAYLVGIGNDLMLLWILPGYIGVVMCPLMFDWPVHHPHTERGRYTDSAILLFPRPIRWLTDLFFQGHAYHLMHHMYPRLPYYRYRTAYYALERELAGFGVKVRRLMGAQ
jgi:beta-carotene hydroxylase